MYKIGDKVVYPGHGAGIIDAVEETVVMGKKHLYYTMRMPVGDMKVMVPVDSAETSGMRRVVSPDEAEKVIAEGLKAEYKDEDVSWNHRFRENSERIKSGKADEVAVVVAMLTKREKQKGLSTGEKKMLSDARQILISELALALNRTYEGVRALVDSELEKDDNV